MVLFIAFGVSFAQHRKRNSRSASSRNRVGVHLVMRGDGKGRGDCDDRGKSYLQITMRVHVRRTNQCKHISPIKRRGDDTGLRGWRRAGAAPL